MHEELSSSLNLLVSHEKGLANYFTLLKVLVYGFYMKNADIEVLVLYFRVCYKKYKIGSLEVDWT
jgi:hypothetical protein